MAKAGAVMAVLIVIRQAILRERWRMVWFGLGFAVLMQVLMMIALIVLGVARVVSFAPAELTAASPVHVRHGSPLVYIYIYI